MKIKTIFILCKHSKNYFSSLLFLPEIKALNKHSWINMHELINNLKLVACRSVLVSSEYKVDLYISWKKQIMGILFFLRKEVVELVFIFQNCDSLISQYKQIQIITG